MYLKSLFLWGVGGWGVRVFLFPRQGSLVSKMLHAAKGLTFACSCPSSHTEVTTTYLSLILNTGGSSQQKRHIVYCVLSEFDLENVTTKSGCHGREAISYCLTVQSVKLGVGKSPLQHLVTLPSCRTTSAAQIQGGSPLPKALPKIKSL